MGAGKGQARRTQGQVSRQLRDSYDATQRDLIKERELAKAAILSGIRTLAMDKGDGESERFVVQALDNHSFGAYDTKEDEIIQYFTSAQYGGYAASSVAARQFVKKANARDCAREQETESKAEKRRKMRESADSIKRVDF